MTALPSLPRLALVLALLPQLLLLGLGQGVVLCIAPGGHWEVETTASDCCTEATSVASVPDSGEIGSPEDSDCGPCTDYRISPNPNLVGSSSAGSFELPLHARAALTIESPWYLPSDCAPWLGRAPDRDATPPHLAHLRSIVLRC